MASTVPVQTRVDSEIKKRAGVVLDSMGLTVSDAVRILLTRIANEGALPAGLTTDAAAHDAWFRAKVQEALDDTRVGIPHLEVQDTMARVRADALRRERKGIVKLVWSALALNDRIGHFDYIAGDSVAAAVKVDDVIAASAEQLPDFPASGRPGRVSGTRELVIYGLPYILIYSVRGDDVFILRVLHGAQQWPGDLTF